LFKQSLSKRLFCRTTDYQQIRMMHHFEWHHARKGQNIVEAALVLPIFIVMAFGLFELAHFWQVAETAKMAAIDAVTVAARSQNVGAGTTHLLARLNQAQLAPTGTTSVTTSADGSSYTATVAVAYRPYFGGLAIPSLAGPITIIPDQIPINYQEIKAVGIL
jgi:Flp pilus assembly protein TadG